MSDGNFEFRCRMHGLTDCTDCSYYVAHPIKEEPVEKVLIFCERHGRPRCQECSENGNLFLRNGGKRSEANASFNARSWSRWPLNTAYYYQNKVSLLQVTKTGSSEFMVAGAGRNGGTVYMNSSQLAKYLNKEGMWASKPRLNNSQSGKKVVLYT